MAETVDLTGGGLQLDPNILILLQALTSNSPSTNQNFAQDLFGQQANSYALGAFLGLQDMSELEQAVTAAAYTPVPDSVYSNMDYERLEQQAVSDQDTILLDAFARIKAGASPEEITNELKSQYLATNTSVAPSSREYKAFELGIEAKQGVLEEFQSRYNGFLDFNDKVQKGEVIQRNGSDYYVTPEKDRLSELSDKGIFGVLADPFAYETDRDRALQAAEKFLADSTAQEKQMAGDIWNQQVNDIKLTGEQTNAIRKLLNQTPDRGVGGNRQVQEDKPWYKDVWDALTAPETIGAQSPDSDPDQMIGAGGSPYVPLRNPKWDEELAARAGIYYSDKNEQAAAQKRDQSNIGFNELKQTNVDRLSQLIDSAEKADNTRSAASNDLNQRAQMMSMLAANNASSSGSGGGGGGGGGSTRGTVSLTDDEINKIVTSLVRR